MLRYFHWWRDSMTEIPKKFQYAGERIINRVGGSKSINIPPSIIESEGLEAGDRVVVYHYHGLMLVDLKPDEEG